MSAAPAPTNENIQVTVLKSIVLDLGWFNGDQTKFEDQWREIQLFLKSNKVMKTDDRIMVILASLKGNVADIYTQ